MFSSSPSFGSGQSEFGAKTDSSNGNHPFAPGSFSSTVATPFGASTAFGQPASNTNAFDFRSGSVFGQTTGGSYNATATPFSSTSTGPAMSSANSSAFGKLANSSSQFGTLSVIFGQTNNSSNHNPFGTGSSGTAATPFGTSTGASMFSGYSTGIFGAPSFAFGTSASSTTTAPFSTFGTSSLSSTAFNQLPSNATLGSQSIFWESNKFGVNNPFASKPVTRSPFGSFYEGAIFSGNSTGSFGETSSSLASKPIFGVPSSFSSGSSTTSTGSWERK